MKSDVEWLSLEIAAMRRLVAARVKRVLQLESEGQPDLADLAQQQLEALLASLDQLKKARRTVLHHLRRPKSAHIQEPTQRKRTGTRV